MRHAAIVVLTAMFLSVLLPAGAQAETEAQLKKRLEALKKETAAAGKAYDSAFWELDETDARLEKLDAKIEATRQELKQAQSTLASHAAGMYRRDELDYLEFLLGAASFEDLVSRADHLSRIGESDAAAIASVKRTKAELEEQRTRLAEEQKKRKANVTALKKKRDALQKQLKAKDAEFRAVQSKLAAARGGSTSGGVTVSKGPNGMVFPVVGSYYYADTWGASRSGGRRRHQGTDIMARRGTTCVAVLSGTVRSKTSNLGGKTIWLTADNGWEFYYAHLDTWVVRSGRVKAGQVIGTVGSTGNASESAPHLHFEIHPGGGSAVNPYPYLRGME